MLSLMGTVVLLTKQVTVNSEANKEEASIIAATRRVRNTSTNMIRINTGTRSLTSIPVQRDHIIEVVHLSDRTLLKYLLVLQDLTDSTLKKKLREYHIEKRSRLKSKNQDHFSRPSRHLSSSKIKTRVTLSLPFTNFIRAALGRLSALKAHSNKRKWRLAREWTSPFHKLGHSSAIAQLADCLTLT